MYAAWRSLTANNLENSKVCIILKTDLPCFDRKKTVNFWLYNELFFLYGSSVSCISGQLGELLKFKDQRKNSMVRYHVASFSRKYVNKIRELFTD